MALFVIFIVYATPVTSKSNSIPLTKIVLKHSKKYIQLYKDYIMFKYEPLVQKIYGSNQGAHNNLVSIRKRSGIGNVNLTNQTLQDTIDQLL